ncbi:hypothetical protein WJX72_005026 [[Myrmecia] bisecta]|uniref:Isoaspartyl dipeptidase n=1 Tax=[Myrmecia] bisecta TaxID=41462 RepID=A0AAW1NZ11_9CHLO
MGAAALVLVKAPAKLYTPAQQAPAHLLLGGGKVLGLLGDAQASLIDQLGPRVVQVLDASSCCVCPGLVDMHVHITGGGGEAGPSSRCPESQLSTFLNAGITTAVGVLGTDSVSRCQENLITKCKALNKDGITCYHWCGSYRIPAATITGSIQRELCLIESCIGVGEVAVSDHRSAVPIAHELARIASEARVGGMLSGCCGLCYCHMGDGSAGLDPLRQALAMSELPITQFLPTHAARNDHLWSDGLQWLREGGNLDITADDRAQHALQDVHDNKPSLLESCTISSDAFGSLPVFDQHGRLVGYDVGDPQSLLQLLQTMVLGIPRWPLEKVLPLLTSQPAARLCLHQKGQIAAGRDADLLLLDSNTLELQYVIANGVLSTPAHSLCACTCIARSPVAAEVSNGFLAKFSTTRSSNGLLPALTVQLHSWPRAAQEEEDKEHARQRSLVPAAPRSLLAACVQGRSPMLTQQAGLATLAEQADHTDRINPSPKGDLQGRNAYDSSTAAASYTVLALGHAGLAIPAVFMPELGAQVFFGSSVISPVHAQLFYLLGTGLLGGGVASWVLRDINHWWLAAVSAWLFCHGVSASALQPCQAGR